MRKIFTLLAAIVVAGHMSASLAQGYPNRPIRIVHGFDAGGGADALMRIVLPRFAEILGQQVYIDYHVGAGGTIAMELVAHAAPDGYTLLLGTPGLAINPSLYAHLSFDPLKDFAPITLVNVVQNVLEVNADVPVNSLQELIAYAKARPGKLNYASSGVGTSLHLAGELFKSRTGLDIVHVPYKGSTQASTAVLTGDTQMMFNVLPTALPQIKAGKIKAIAVTGKTRSPALPAVPTMQEAGVPNYVAVTWNGLLAPAGTPRNIVLTLNRAMAQALQSPKVQANCANAGAEGTSSSPEEFAQLLRDETTRWSGVIGAAGIQPQ
jgi:tripartite-type tricarboxylate transporter receptor subunit TctC